MKRRILLVDDEVAILLTLKAVLEISGFDVETAASAREAKAKLRHREYHMIITDMRMENEAAGTDVIQAARSAPYHPAVALLTAFPVDEEGWDGAGPDKILVKATQTKVLLQQIEKLFATHAAKLSKLAVQVAGKGAATDGQNPLGGNGAAARTASTGGRKKAVVELGSASLATLAASAQDGAIPEQPKGKPARPSARKMPVRSGTH